MLSSVSVDNTSRLPTQPLSAVQVWSCHAWARIESAVQPVLDVVLPRNPVTKCRQIRIVPTWVENTLGVMNYDSLCPLYRTSRNAQLNAAVSDVGARLVEHCDRKELDFEFRVLKDDNVVNAFCLPGGKIAITTGLLDKLQHESVGDAELDALPFEDKLAAVLGH
ncbi:MAG: M48 family metalloprotease [Chlamydiia bacterium]|nr:M48 family metalloprotease [Chlamydiia bacterium]